jgi:hypothetical protein
MFSRIRSAIGFALILTLFTSMHVFAKGNFSFISITGKDLKEPVRLSDPALTADFFTFADFYQSKTKAPVDPGMNYEITRYYVDGNRESAFDKLHYYPDTGFVYYDGIVNGSSEYDGKWYIAKPEIKSVFETALSTQIRLVALGSEPSANALVPPSQPVQTRRAFAQPALVVSVIAASLVLILALVFRRRRISIQ